MKVDALQPSKTLGRDRQRTDQRRLLEMRKVAHTPHGPRPRGTSFATYGNFICCSFLSSSRFEFSFAFICSFMEQPPQQKRVNLTSSAAVNLHNEILSAPPGPQELIRSRQKFCRHTHPHTHTESSTHLELSAAYLTPALEQCHIYMLPPTLNTHAG